MASFNILDLTHWEAWGYLLLTWKQKYSLPTVGNYVVFGNSTGARGKLLINGVKQGGVDVAWTLIFCFRGVTQGWISSVFEMPNVFLISVLSSFSIWNDIIVRVKLVVYDVWLAEDDNIDFLSVGVDIFDRLYFEERPISLPMLPMSTTKQIYDKWDYVRKIDKNRSMWNFWWIFRILFLGYPSPMEKLEKSKNDR